MRVKLETTYNIQRNLKDIYIPIISRSGFTTEINMNDRDELEVYIDINSFEDLFKLHKELGIELIIRHDYHTKEPLIEIYDDYRE